MSIIALFIWEAMVLWVGYQFFKSTASNATGGLEDFGGILIMTLVVIGLAVLPFTSAF